LVSFLFKTLFKGCSHLRHVGVLHSHEEEYACYIFRFAHQVLHGDFLMLSQLSCGVDFHSCITDFYSILLVHTVYTLNAIYSIYDFFKFRFQFKEPFPIIINDSYQSLHYFCLERDNIYRVLLFWCVFIDADVYVQKVLIINHDVLSLMLDVLINTLYIEVILVLW
jgi:hypothetical protein